MNGTIYKIQVLESDNDGRVLLRDPLEMRILKIFPDDTIHTVKLKIVYSMLHDSRFGNVFRADDILSKDAMYLFGETDLLQLPLTPQEQEESLPTILAQLREQGQEHLVAENDSLATIKHILQREKFGVRTLIPLGVTFENALVDPRFATNPFTFLQNNYPLERKLKPTHNDKLLLHQFGANALFNNTIFVCLANRVLAAAPPEKHPYLQRVYFPLWNPNASREVLLQRTQQLLGQHHVDRWRTVQLLYSFAAPVPYEYRGLKGVQLRVRNAHATSVDLETIFKNLHATKDVPFIKWNPGPKREKLVRLYHENVTTDGRPIPFLPEKTVAHLSRVLGEHNEVSLWLRGAENAADISHAFLHFEQKGSIILDLGFHRPLKEPEVDTIIETRVWGQMTPLLLSLREVGFRMEHFTSMREPSTTEVLDVTLVAAANVNKQKTKTHWTKAVPCVESVCNVYETARKQTAPVVRWKRVNNYKAMFGKDNVLQQLLEQQNIEELVKQKMAENLREAQIMVDDHMTRNRKNAANKPNPGFPIETRVIGNVIGASKVLYEFTVRNISSVHHLDIMESALNSLFQTAFFVSPNDANMKQMAELCANRREEEEEKEEEEDQSIDHAETESNETEYTDTDEPEEDENDKESQEDDDEEDNDEEDDDENERYVGLGGGDGNDEEDDDAIDELHGRKNTQINAFLEKLKVQDPQLFAYKADGKFNSYSRVCNQYPVALTDEEFAATDPAAYSHQSFRYGSSASTQHHFTCPKFWCTKTNKPLTEEEARNPQVCGDIIPKNAKTRPPGAYVLQLHEKTTFPGFNSTQNPAGFCLPCCFGKDRTDKNKKCLNKGEEQQEEEKEQPPSFLDEPDNNEDSNYILGSTTHPLHPSRKGFLSISLQDFFEVNYETAVDGRNPHFLRPNVNTVLREGVEQVPNQSFLGCFAAIYAAKRQLNTVPRVDNFRALLAEKTSLDVFVRMHNGALLSTFSPQNVSNLEEERAFQDERARTSRFAAGLDLHGNLSHKEYFVNAVLSHRRFLAFLTDPQSTITHEYLWDFVCTKITNILPDGLNLIVLHVVPSNVREEVRMLCPSSAYAANATIDRNKDTAVLVLQNGIYELVSFCTTSRTKDIVSKFLFGYNTPVVYWKRLLKLADEVYSIHCKPKPPANVKQMAASPNAREVAKEIEKRPNAFRIETEVLNYQGKLVGFMVQQLPKADAEEKGEEEEPVPVPVYVPCRPSSQRNETRHPFVFLDNESLPKSYANTVRLLEAMSSLGLPMQPVLQMKREVTQKREGKVNLEIHGVLVKCGLYVPVVPIPFTEAPAMDNKLAQDPRTADKVFALDKTTDKDRVKTVHSIELEGEFYFAFRNRVRSLLALPANRSLKEQMQHSIQNFDEMMKAVTTLIQGHVVFVDVAPSVLEGVVRVFSCETAEDVNRTTCIEKLHPTKGVQLVIPKENLITKVDNEFMYVARLADELLRNERVKELVYPSYSRMNARNADYDVGEKEFVVFESSLNADFWKDLKPDETVAQNADLFANFDTARGLQGPVPKVAVKVANP